MRWAAVGWVLAAAWLLILTTTTLNPWRLNGLAAEAADRVGKIFGHHVMIHGDPLAIKGNFAD